MTQPLTRIVLAGLSAVLCLPLTAAAGTPSAAVMPRSVHATLTRLEEGEMSWQDRTRALVDLARGGPDVVRPLGAALGHDSPRVRGFAAHALALLATPDARPALASALADPEQAVRINAVRALSLLGRLELSEQQREALERNDGHWWGPNYIQAALGRGDAADRAALRKALAGYDTARIDTARLGQTAPDLELRDASGRLYRLSDYRGRKVVALEFDSGEG